MWRNRIECASATRILLAALIICLASDSTNGDSPYVYKTSTISVPLDHFSYASNVTFDMRYLINNTFWQKGGPIFFYTGNEGDIETFAQNTGFMWDIAPDYNAMLVFAEHRYYGKSLPFQNVSYLNPEHLGYLTSTQALADFVYLLNNLQDDMVAKHKRRAPVIAFGGSYGGMLAAWMRLKYPWAINGALASSAPIYQFQGMTKCSTYTDLVANVFQISSRTGECPNNIKKGWKAIRNIASTKQGKDWLNAQWKLCQPLNSTNDVEALVAAISNIFGTVAMINYPYPTDFLMPVPAHPIRVMCEKLDDRQLDNETLLIALNDALSVYTNYTGAVKCLNINNTSGSISDAGWGFQACTELVMPMCNDPKNIMFEPQAWDFKKYSDDCYKSYGVKVDRDDIAELLYGGKKAEYSNVIFTNGFLDPWSPGGVLKSNTSSVYTIVIPEAAHHLDLRAKNPNDPGSVTYARSLIRNIFNVWLKEIKHNNDDD